MQTKVAGGQEDCYPEYVDDDAMCKYADCGFIGSDMWHVTGDTTFYTSSCATMLRKPIGRRPFIGTLTEE